MQNFEELKQEALGAIRGAERMVDLRDAEVKYLGRSGKLTGILRGLKDLPEAERKVKGKEANTIRVILETEIAARTIALEKVEEDAKLSGKKIDITQPGIKHRRGGLHPLTKLRREAEQIFSSLGFEIVDGPEVEYEWYNFDALNIPVYHPARDMQDTFWIRADADPKKWRLLPRTHTSPVQIRFMEKHQPPFRIIVPGRVFRHEASDASHDIQFHQLEGLMIGRDISVAHFKHIIGSFFQKLFKREVVIRLRPSYFPFTEPSFEVDISCLVCYGAGCSVCKQSGWLEMGGAGMVHPHVFKAAGLNPKEWQGFAFGFGIDRVAMMKYKIPDIRLFYSGDIRFLKQF